MHTIISTNTFYEYNPIFLDLIVRISNFLSKRRILSFSNETMTVIIHENCGSA